METISGKMVATGGVTTHGHEPEVGTCSEALVEAHLGLARAATSDERAEVEELERDGLLDLVDLTLGHEDPRDVGLAQLDVIGMRCGVRLGTKEVAHEVRGWDRQRLASQGGPHATHDIARASSGSG